MTRNGPVLRPLRNPGAFAVRRRFQTLLGKRRTMEAIDVLSHAHAAYLGLKRSASAIRGRGANIFTQWVGDPDALGSALALKAILTSLGAREVRILTGSLGHPQNRKLVERCGLVLHDPNSGRIRTGLHCMVDTSPPLGMTNTIGVEPVNDYFFVADHHADPADVEENCRARGVKRVQLPFVGLEIGSTSAFLAVLATAFGVIEKLTAAERAAVALGIYTDTSALLHGATALDFKMFEVLTRTVETQDILDELRDYRVPPEWNAYRGAAFRNEEVTGAVRVGAIGFVKDDDRDVIAEIANELLRVEDTSIAVAIGVTTRGVEVSIRADSRLLGQNQRRIVGVIDYLLETAFPGVSGFKHDRRPPHRVEGGACVPLTPEQREEWRLDGNTRVAGNGPVLAHCKELARMLVAALRDLEALQPQEMEGVLSLVEGAAGDEEADRPPTSRQARSANGIDKAEKGRAENGRKVNGRTENGRKENGRSDGRTDEARQENGKRTSGR